MQTDGEISWIQNRRTSKINNSNNKDPLRSSKNTITTKIIKGTRETTKGQSAFCATKQRVWLHIGKTQLGTTSAIIENHLKQLFPGRSSIIDELKQKAEATSICHSR